MEHFPGQVKTQTLTHSQVCVLTSSACTDVFDSFTSAEPRSTKEVAVELGKSPSSVGEHVEKLVAVGLLIPATTRKRGARTETFYVHRSRDHILDLENVSEETLQKYLKKFRWDMRQTERYHEVAQRAHRVDPALRRYMNYMTFSGYLNAETVLALKRVLDQAHQLFLDSIEHDPEVRKTGEYVRVKFATLLLPTQNESESRLKPTAQRAEKKKRG